MHQQIQMDTITPADGLILPVEILQEIFACSSQFRDPLDRMAFPLTLGSVCKLWHAIAVETPCLWSTIVFNHRVTCREAYSVVENQSRQYQLGHIFLRNSQQSQLNIYVKLTTSNRDKSKSPSFGCPSASISRREAKSSVLILASLLAPHASRFRRFHILSTRYNPVRDLLSAFPQVPMPFLEELHIDRVQDSYSYLHFDCPRACSQSLAIINMQHLSNYDVPENFSDNFPALKSVALSSVPLLLPVFTPSHLTSLKMTLPHLNFTGELRSLLLASSDSLENLSIMSTSCFNPLQTTELISPVPLNQLVTFQRLTKLSISFADPDTLLPLLSYLRLPSVASLRISSVRKPHLRSTQNLFQGMLDCLPFQELEELALEHIFANDSPNRTPLLNRLDFPHHPYNILAHAIAVKVLTITTIDPHALFYLNTPSALGVVEDGLTQMRTPLSRLTHLHLVPTGESSRDLENVLNFVRERNSRAEDLSLLQELKITGPFVWAYDLAATDTSHLAQRVLLSPSRRRRPGGIWDDDIASQSLIEIDGVHTQFPDVAYNEVDIH